MQHHCNTPPQHNAKALYKSTATHHGNTLQKHCNNTATHLLQESDELQRKVLLPQVVAKDIATHHRNTPLQHTTATHCNNTATTLQQNLLKESDELQRKVLLPQVVTRLDDER